MAKFTAGAALKTNFFLLGRKRTLALTYGSVLVFIVFTLILAFNSSPNRFNSPCFSTYDISDHCCRYQFSSIYYYFFKNSSPASWSSPQSSNFSEADNVVSQAASIQPKPSENTISSRNLSLIEGFDVKIIQPASIPPTPSENTINSQNLSRIEGFDAKIEVLKEETVNESGIGGTNSTNTPATPLNVEEVIKQIPENKTMMNTTTNNQMKSLMNCDMFDGEWIEDNSSYPLYEPGSCSLIDEQFDCFLNGRPDNGYYKLKWKPKGCILPRLDGKRMLKLLNGKRLVFVGDSLNRNMWESLICILKNSARNKTKVYEQSGRQQFRSDSSFSFIFEDYKFSVEFFVTPFLVQEWEVTNKNGTKKETLRLDLIRDIADQYKNADIIVFNSGHWWTHEKTSAGIDYYQEGSHVYPQLDALEAFRKALTTWGRWVDSNIDPIKSLVFFRGYSSSHFSGGQWNSGGACDNETEPIHDEKYLTMYPNMMNVLEQVLSGMRTEVGYLNVTRMTDYRKDGHPSVYRKRGMTEEERRKDLVYQDCSHWCLPGVPDTWNEILYAQLLVKQKQQKRRKRLLGPEMPHH